MQFYQQGRTCSDEYTGPDALQKLQNKEGEVQLIYNNNNNSDFCGS